MENFKIENRINDGDVNGKYVPGRNMCPTQLTVDAWVGARVLMSTLVFKNFYHNFPMKWKPFLFSLIIAVANRGHRKKKSK